MLQRTLDTLSSCPAVDALVVVVNAGRRVLRARDAQEQIEKVVAVTAGGDERALSVRNGLLAWPKRVPGTWWACTTAPGRW